METKQSIMSSTFPAGNAHYKWLKDSKDFINFIEETKIRKQTFLVLMNVTSLYVWVIDQAWGQDGWILAKFFFCVFMDRDEVEVHKHAKKERG